LRRRYNLAASIGSSIGTTMMGVSVLSQQDLDALGGQMFGLDPFVVLGLTTAGFGAIGWLAGPFVGNAVFSAMNRRFKGQIAEVSSQRDPIVIGPHPRCGSSRSRVPAGLAAVFDWMLWLTVLGRGR